MILRPELVRPSLAEPVRAWRRAVGQWLAFAAEIIELRRRLGREEADRRLAETRDGVLVAGEALVRAARAIC